MEQTNYPSTIGVPTLALIGPSGAGKSTLTKKLLPQKISAAAKIEGKSSAQTTLIPTHFYIRQELSCIAEQSTQLKLRITFRTHSDSKQSTELSLDEDAVYVAVQHGIDEFVKNSKGSSGIPMSALCSHITSGKYAENLCKVVNGAVRLEAFATDDQFKKAAEQCATSLVEKIDIRQIDSAVSSMKSDEQKKQARGAVLRDQLRVVWDQERKVSNSSVCELLDIINDAIHNKLREVLHKPLSPLESKSLTFSLDVSNEDDSCTLTALLDPYSPLSLVIQQYEIACAMGKNFQRLFEDQYSGGYWIDERLPFRLIITDTVGLDQDWGNDDDVTKRLNAALDMGCHGILLMLMPGMKDSQIRAIQRKFSTETEEGRKIRNKKIPVFLGIARADDEVTPSITAEEDDFAYRDEMVKIWDSLSAIKQDWQTKLNAEDARYITNQPKKIKAFLDDLDEVDSDLANKFRKDFGIKAAFQYFFDITVKLQKQIFPNETPIFYHATAEEENGNIKLRVVTRNDLTAAVSELKEFSQKYYVPQWLHWNTAYAFYNATLGGYRFASRAVQNGRISIYIRGDVSKSIHEFKMNWDGDLAAETDIKTIDLHSEDSKSLLERLEVDVNSPYVEDHLKCKLYEMFKENFTGDSSWRFLRAIEQVICRLSYSDPDIREGAINAFQEGRRAMDANEGVIDMLNYYKHIYEHEDLPDVIAKMINEELTKEFNSFFFPLYG